MRSRDQNHSVLARFVDLGETDCRWHLGKARVVIGREKLDLAPQGCLKSPPRGLGTHYFERKTKRQEAQQGEARCAKPKPETKRRAPIRACLALASSGLSVCCQETPKTFHGVGSIQARHPLDDMAGFDVRVIMTRGKTRGVMRAGHYVAIDSRAVLGTGRDRRTTSQGPYPSVVRCRIRKDSEVTWGGCGCCVRHSLASGNVLRMILSCA